jgi:integrase
MSHTIPVTHIDSSEPYRCYVQFYYNGERQRIYNAKFLGRNCNPNYQKKMGDRKRELARLCQLIAEALKDGWYPGKELEQVKEVYQPTAAELIQQVQSRYTINGWSTTYQRDMTRISNELVEYLNLTHPLVQMNTLTSVDLAKFLDNYRSSGRYYMNKRRNLSALFKLLKSEPNPVAATPTMKVTELLNEAYTPEELMSVLRFLERGFPNLYLCALLIYGTLLRPHREIRLLRRRDFDQTFDFILLSGKAVKNGKIRKVPVPDYVKAVLLQRNVHTFNPDDNLFTGLVEPFNADYFTTSWSRAKMQMRKQGIISENQTLYSFRHSAAVYTFENTQNLKLLQGLLGHGSPDVTLKYLRSMGITEAASPDDLPKLPKF